MQTSVLLSIKPTFAAAIFSGAKKFEFRRTVYRAPSVKTVWVYASAPISMVIGCFSVDDVLSLHVDTLWKRTRHAAGISKEGFFEYFSGKKLGHALVIGTRHQLVSPVALAAMGVNTAPQSFQYVSRSLRHGQAARNG